jgi:hypothetical protein
VSPLDAGTPAAAQDPITIEWPEPRSRWAQVTAATVSAMLIVAALAMVVLSGFISAPSPATVSTSLVATAAQRAPLLATPICVPHRGHRCGRTTPANAKAGATKKAKGAGSQPTPAAQGTTK